MSKTVLPLDNVIAIDVHTHAERARGGADRLPRHLREAANKYFGRELPVPDAQEVADYHRQRRMMAAIFTVDSEAASRVPQCQTRR